MRIRPNKRFYWSRFAPGKLALDAGIILLSAAAVFWLLPGNVAFFNLASVHTTFGQKALHTLVALATILSCRFLVGSSGRSWWRDYLRGLLSIGISDMVAGVVYYVITEYLMQSVYPFLLTFSLFALICVVSLFARLLYRGVNEAAQMTEQ